MSVRSWQVFCAATILFGIAGAAHLEAAPKSPKPKRPRKSKKAPVPISVAVLNYEIKLPDNKGLGSQMADILTAHLSIEGSIRLVERARLGKILDEHKLTLSGAVGNDRAVRVGKLVGAQLLIMGRGFMMDKKLHIVTQVVGVETGLLCGDYRFAETSKPVSQLILTISKNVAKLIRDKGAELLPTGSTLPDPVAAIRRQLGKKTPSVVAVVIPEEHRARPTASRRAVSDPAAETEIKRTLLACGFKVVDTGRNSLANWARAMSRKKKPTWPAALKDADVVVVGEAFSEFALRTGDLITCVGRAEINAIDRRSGRIIFAGSHTARAVDLAEAEAIAGKTALQKAGRKLGVALGKVLVRRKPATRKPKPKARSKAGGSAGKAKP